MLVLALIGCPYVGPSGYADLQDLDGDGSISVRFGGFDCRDDDANITTCDNDGDQEVGAAFGGLDCDDNDPNVFSTAPERCDGIDNDCDGRTDDDDDVPQTNFIDWFPDADRDGFGTGAPIRRCAAPEGFVDNDLDCNDARDDVFPAAPEFCDAIDHDCDGQPQLGATNPTEWFQDLDEDGSRGAPTVTSCEIRPGELSEEAPLDCDDENASIGPHMDEEWYDGLDQDCDGRDDYDQDGDGDRRLEDGGADCDDLDAETSGTSPEVCDGRDNDCDGATDDDDPDVDILTFAFWYPDNDQDGFGSESSPARRSCAPAAFEVDVQGDCDDNYALTFPGAPEVCDGLDNDCLDGGLDENAIDGTTVYRDQDEDGFGGDAFVLRLCDPSLVPPGYLTTAGDCDDTDPNTYEGAVEICGDDVRQDCSEADVLDCDADGFLPINLGGTDCDDTSSLAFVGGTEVCDGVDNDCDGTVDVNADGADRMWFLDTDGDGFGGTDFIVSCAPPPQGVLVDGDCDDDSPNAHPGADEVCDGEDNDCDGLTDDADEDGVTGVQPFFRDDDRDGFGVGEELFFCDPPTDRFSTVNGDCDDGIATVNPLGDEVCNGVDDDCNELVDDGAPDASIYFLDNDFDGFGEPTLQVFACSPAPGRVANEKDCNDADDTVFPGADEVCGDTIRQDCSLADVRDCDADGVLPFTEGGDDCDDENPMISPLAVEICDGLDNDCDALLDDQDPDVDASAAADWFADVDSDGVGGAAAVTSCSPPAGHVSSTGDCDDNDALVFPGALEVCDAVDNDCDQLVDDDDDVANPPFWYQDLDNDGIGTDAVGTFSCLQPQNTSAVDGDCRDNDPNISPLAPEVCNGIDDDCDDQIDDGDSDTISQPAWFPDADGDGYPRDSGQTVSCAQPDGTVALSGLVDCNDTNALVNPGATEICNAGLDDDCDGQADADDDDFEGAEAFYQDLDGDGYGPTSSRVEGCEQPAGFVAVDGDCDDASAAVNPGATEVCNGGIDDDCDGPADDFDASLTGGSTFYLDDDDDGLGTPTTSVLACVRPFRHVDNPDDCDDTTALVGRRLWVVDADEDGEGDALGTPVSSCTQPSGTTADALATDCDDSDPTIRLGANEVYYDGRDNDCDASTVDDDQDGDGFAGTATPVLCDPSAPRDLLLDCDDLDSTRSPARTEVFYDSIDQNCYCADDFDADGDGWAADAPDGILVVPGSRGVNDCDDDDAGVRPSQDPSIADEWLVTTGSAATVQSYLDTACDPTLRVDGNVVLDDGWVVRGRAVTIECESSPCSIATSETDAPLLTVRDSTERPLRPDGLASNVTITDVELDGQQLARSVPGVVLEDHSQLSITNGSLVGFHNLPTPGGALRVASGSRAQIQNSVFDNNISAVSGAAAYVQGTFVSEETTYTGHIGSRIVHGTSGSRIRLVGASILTDDMHPVGLPHIGLEGEVAVLEDMEFRYLGSDQSTTSPFYLGSFVEHEPADFGELWVIDSAFAGAGGISGTGGIHVCKSRFARAQTAAIRTEDAVLDVTWSDVVVMRDGIDTLGGLLTIEDSILHISQSNHVTYRGFFDPGIRRNYFTGINFNWVSGTIDIDSPNGDNGSFRYLSQASLMNTHGSGQNPHQPYAGSDIVIGTDVQAALDRITGATTFGSTAPLADCSGLNPPTF